MEPTPASVHALPWPASTLEPGTELGRYRIIKLLSEGGMGQVYVAEQNTLGRRVALKVLRPELSSSPDLTRRFLQEARVVNSINHEHIIDVFDLVAEPNERIYYVMELLEGGDLFTTRGRQGPFSLSRILKIGREIAQALSAAHEKNVIHRDLKPENVFLTNRNRDRDFVKLLDFGVAKLAEPMGHNGTTSGVALGTPLYMSPEQSMGVKVDQRSDVYALGLVLYWMIRDQLPFLAADSYGHILVERQTTPPEPLPSTSAAGEKVPKHLAAAVMECLEKDPDDRIASADALLDRLHEPTVQWRQLRPGGEAAAPASRWRTAASFAAGALVGGLASALVARAVLAPQPAPPEAPLARADAPETHLPAAALPPATDPSPPSKPALQETAAATPATPHPQAKPARRVARKAAAPQKDAEAPKTDLAVPTFGR